MKKKLFQKKAFLGLLSGLLTLEQVNADDSKKPASQDYNDSNLGYHLLSDDELKLELNDEGYRLYMSMDEEGRKLAREVASARCDHTNLCKGLNACKTDKNDCAGKGKCKGQGKCAFSDKNLAVKLASKKMAEKRINALQTSP